MNLNKEKKMVSSEQFVRVYIKLGGDLDAVSRELGSSRNVVKQRVMRMRKAGVKLPLKKQGKKYQVQALNQLIKELKKGN